MVYDRLRVLRNIAALDRDGRSQGLDQGRRFKGLRSRMQVVVCHASQTVPKPCPAAEPAATRKERQVLWEMFSGTESCLR